MSQANTLICRLCGSQNGVFINIFESSPANDCIEKIEAVVPDVVILRDDSLSKFICHRCVSKVKEFYDFKAACLRTQKVLKNKLPWLSSGQKTAPLRAVSPTIKFIGGPLAYPFGQKEPEVEVLTLSDDEDVEGNASLNVDQPSGHKQPQVVRSLETNSLPGPVPLEDSRTQPSLGWNGNTPPGMGTQNSTVQSATARMGSGRKITPSRSFRSVLQFDQQAAVNQPGYHYYPETDSEPCALPPTKRTRRQSQFRSPKKAESDNLSVTNRSIAASSTSSPAATPSVITRASSVATPSTISRTLSVATPSTISRTLSVATPSTISRTSSLATPSTISRTLSVATPSTISRASSVATPSTISRPSSVATSSTVSRPSDVGTPTYMSESSSVARPSSTSDHYLRDVSFVPIANTVSTPRPFENAFAPDGENNNLTEDRHSSCTLVSGNKVCDRPVQPKPKPKPKSKKKPVELTEADVNNIRSKYPTIEPVKICGNTIIFTCTLCNKMLLTEEAICNHECLSSQVTEAKNSSGQCDCDSSYVELSSDDETTNDTERHMCTICSRLFHSSSRLQKHLETHP
ncbi:flocculation protein FLO11-like [Thrips palmi]|uniref:Flocculation protein FLO11-like n=1 Tax=Thrips palmi TaxID=161013 RepID=A0A6P9ADN8_THRPL|nr:flocculation protein FLO11-like [Thrips palmi]